MFERRQEILDKYDMGEIVADWHQKIRDRTVTSRGHEVKPVSTTSGYVLSGQSGFQYVVNLEARTCTCRVWFDQKVLCSHVIAFLSHLNISPREYVDAQFMVSNLFEFYSHGIPAIDFTSLKSEGKCLVPPIRRKRGRPKRSRIPSRGESIEKGKKNKCRQCHRMGHNIRSCPNNQ